MLIIEKISLRSSSSLKDDRTVVAGAKYSMFITKSKKKSLYYNRSNSFLYANRIKIHFKAKDAETKPYLLCFGKF